MPSLFSLGCALAAPGYSHGGRQQYAKSCGRPDHAQHRAWRITVGHCLRGWLHLGFNQDETTRRRVHDGLWPIIAGRRIALNFRRAQPDGALERYQAGSEGPRWWSTWPDQVRDLLTRGNLERCRETNTCPKAIERVGCAKVWALQLTPEWVGTDAKHDIPLPENVRRYCIPSSTHGGGAGGFNAGLSDVALAAVGPNCQGNNLARVYCRPIRCRMRRR